MRIDELTHPGRWDVAQYLRERDMKYGTPELKMLAVVKPQTDKVAISPHRLQLESSWSLLISSSEYRECGVRLFHPGVVI